MTDLLMLLLRASVWLTVGVLLLAVARPLLLRLGGGPLAYRSWWLLPLLLTLLVVPLPYPPAALPDGMALLAMTKGAASQNGPWVTASGGATLLAALWGLGAGLALLRACIAQRRFERQLGVLRQRGDGSWQADVDAGLPALVGVWRPRIIVGPGFDTRFDPQQRNLVLQHERSHRDHGDHWVNAVVLLMRCLFWFHPLAAWSARRLQRDQELACDARVLRLHPAHRRSYATALLTAQLAHPIAPVACHWRGQPVLKERISMMKQGTSGRVPVACGYLMVAGLCIGAGGMAWASQGAGSAPALTAAPVDRDIKAAQMAAPDYPEEAFERGITGKVVLRVDVDADGKASGVSVVSATPAGVFEAASVEAARQWTFTPAMRDGRNVPGTLQIPVQFALDQPPVGP